MNTKNYQGKTKQNHDAAELMAFVGVIGAWSSIIAYFIFVIIACQLPEKVEPVKTPNVVRTYTIHVQPNGVTTFPKFVPYLKVK